MASQPALLVIDDGELGDLVSQLNEMGLEFAHLRGSAIPDQIKPPERVIVTTPRRAMLTKDWPRGTPYRIAVVTEDSNTLRAMLRRVGFDMLLRRPIHPVALRLVLLRALYAGVEKRREERVAVGLDVQFRSGFWRKRALLADLSQRGCRLLAEQALSPGARINLPLPNEVSPDGLTLACKVVRVGAKPEEDGRFEIGLAFEGLSKEKLAAVRAVLRRLGEAAGMEETRLLGGNRARAAAAAAPPAQAAPAPAQKPTAPDKPAARAARPPLAPPRPLGAPAPARVAPPTPLGNLQVAPAAKAQSAPAAKAAQPASAAPEKAEGGDRRQSARAAFGQKIARLDDEAKSVLLGRDLSVGGMRVEYHERVRLGEQLELAIYVSPREEPIVVKARVAREAGDGFGLAFEDVPQEVQTRLEKLIARLPSVEPLQAGEAAGLGSVVSRVLSGFDPED
jgi:c-di-GMP-binding flagellar brake protein YcgR